LRHFKLAAAAVATLGCLWFASPASALNFLQPAGSPYATGKLESNSVRTGDLNNDGRDDLFTTNADPSVSIFLANADGSLTQAPESPIFIGDYAPSGNLGDFNNDGDLDFATASDEIVRVRLGSGEGTFGFPTAFVTESSGVDIAAADFTGDGNVDLLVLGYGQNNVSLLVGNGDGSFADPVTFPVPGGPVSVAVADFNGDNSPDFAVVTETPAQGLRVMLNTGDGNFTGTSYSTGNSARGITSGDFDDDGDADLAIALRPDNSMQALYGDGTGNFSSTTVTPDSNWSNSVASADFDEDGFDDVLLGMGTNISNPLINSAPIFMGSSSPPLVASPDGPWAATSPASPWRVATLTSSGIGPVNIPAGGVTITGLNAGDYQIDSEDCASQTLNTGESCQVKVVFAPTAFGGKNAALEVAHDATGSPTTVTLSGFGTANPGIAIDPASHDFGSRRITVDTSSQTFTVDSTGTTPLSIGIGDIQITGADAGQFSIESDDCSGFLIQPESSCEVVVRFAPTTVGAKSASLSVSSNAPNGPHTAALTGTGTPFAYPSFDPEQLHFGEVPVGTGPTAPLTFTVTAMGASPLEFDTLEIDQLNGNPGDFSITQDDCLGESIPVGQTCQFSVDFVPGAVGARSGRVRWHAPGIQGLLFMDGTGTDPDFTIEPATRDFGTRLTDKGPGTPQTFTLTSTGTTDLEIGAAALAGAASTQFEITSDACSNQTLPPSSSCEIGVAFGPTTAGEKVAELSVPIAGVGPASAQLTGSGQKPVPPPDPCAPVAIRKVAYYKPSIKKRSNIPGVRARITTAGPAVVRISSKLIYHLNGRQGQIKYPQRQFTARTGSVNYKVAIPGKLRGKLKPKKRVRFVITYASKANKPQCTKFGKKKTRNLTTRIVWVIPNA
jgi:hypothetical protein